MKNETFVTVILSLALIISGIFAGCVIACNTADKRVVNQLCRKQMYDFCEIDTYKMKGDLK